MALQALQRSGWWPRTGFGGLDGSDRLVHRCLDSLCACRVMRGIISHYNKEENQWLFFLDMLSVTQKNQFFTLSNVIFIKLYHLKRMYGDIHVY